jgi:alpha-1,2-mannosyltransferase
MISDKALRAVLSPAKVALFGDLIRWSTWAFVLVVLASFMRAHLRLWWMTATDTGKSDFTIFYYTAKMMGEGLSMYAPLPHGYGITWPLKHLGNLNPPHFQLLTFPLRYMSFTAGFVAWLVAGLACLIASLGIVWRELDIRKTPRAFLVAGAAITAMAPFLLVSATGELTYFLLLPLTLGWQAMRRHRWAAAGLWLGVCASLKVFLLLLLPWLIVQRRWTAVLTFVGTLAALAGVGLAAFGVETYRGWFETLGRVGWWEMSMNASWTGFARRIGHGAGPWVTWTANIGAAAICLASLLFTMRRVESRDAVDLAVATLLTGALLASPLGWTYYMPLLLGPAIAAGHVLARSKSWVWMAVVAVGLACLYVPDETAASYQKGLLGRATVGSTFFWGLALLWVTLLHLTAQSRGAVTFERRSRAA